MWQFWSRQRILHANYEQIGQIDRWLEDQPIELGW